MKPFKPQNLANRKSGFGLCLACDKWEENTMAFYDNGLLLNFCEWAYYDYFDE